MISLTHHDYIIDTETGSLRMTDSGMEKYRTRFSRAGVDITTIRSVEDFNSALGASFRVILRDEARRISESYPPSLDRNLLLAVLEDRADEAERLQALAERRNRTWG